MRESNLVLLMMTAFIVKHFLADFKMQTVYMLGKGKGGTAWILPLSAHCLVHAVFTLVIFLSSHVEHAILLATLDFSIHFIVDRIKATYKLKEGKWEDSERGQLLGKFYESFGMDQMAHYLTYVALIQISLM